MTDNTLQVTHNFLVRFLWDITRKTAPLGWPQGTCPKDETLEDLVLRVQGALLRLTTSHYTLAEASEARNAGRWQFPSMNLTMGIVQGSLLRGPPTLDYFMLDSAVSYARGNSVEAHLVYSDGLGLHKIRQILTPPTLPSSMKVSVQNSGSCGQILCFRFVV